MNSPFGAVIGMAQSAWNHDLAEQSAQNQYERQLDFWNKQNEYNSPINQRKRMQDAGMSPVDAVQSQPAGELSSAPGNEFAQQGTLNFVEQLKSFSEMEKLGAESDLLAQELRIAFVKEAVEKGKLFGIELDNQQQKIILKYLDKKEQWSLEQLIAEVENTKQDTATSSALEGKYKSESSSIDAKLPFELDSLSAGIYEKRAHTAKLLEEADFIRGSKELNYNLIKAQTDREKAAAAKLWAEKSLIPTLESMYKAQTGAFNASAELSRQQADKVEEECIQLLDSREFNLAIKEATADEAKANAAIAEMKQLITEHKSQVLVTSYENGEYPTVGDFFRFFSNSFSGILLNLMGE